MSSAREEGRSHSEPVVETSIQLNTLLPRLCPGRHMANATLFIFIASILHAFTITGPIGEDDAPAKMEYKATDTMVSYVLLLFIVRSLA